MIGQVAAHGLFSLVFNTCFPDGLTGKARHIWCRSLVTIPLGSGRWGFLRQVVCVVAVFKVQVFGLDINRAIPWFFCREWFSVLTKQSILLTRYSAVPDGACMHFPSYLIHTSLHFSVTNLYSCCRYSRSPFIRIYNLSKTYHLIPESLTARRWMLCWNVNEACKC